MSIFTVGNITVTFMMCKRWLVLPTATDSSDAIVNRHKEKGDV
jgi:hypothetical protein